MGERVPEMTLTLPELHSLHARSLTAAADCRRDYAKGGTRWHTAEQAWSAARMFVGAARNARERIAARKSQEISQ